MEIIHDRGLEGNNVAKDMNELQKRYLNLIKNCGNEKERMQAEVNIIEDKYQTQIETN